MSHYSTIKTKLVDVEIINQAIAEMGFSLKIGSNLPLYNYLGNKSRLTADMVISRNQLTHVSNDIGLRKEGESYEVVISDFDSGTVKTKDFVKMLQQKYAYLKVKKELSTAHFSVIREEVQRDGTIQIVAEQ